MNKKPEDFSGEIALQSWLCPEVSQVRANCDYEAFQRVIREVDSMIVTSGLETLAVRLDFQRNQPDGIGAAKRRAEWVQRALRIELARNLLGQPSFRAFSVRVADSQQLADFCRARTLSGISGVSKSTLDRASKLFDADMLRQLHGALVRVATDADTCGKLGLPVAVLGAVELVDGTCLPANIHYPVDWLLLRDVAGTLLKAVQLIRNYGLCKRMPQSPAALCTAMNRLCLQMTHAGRGRDARRVRKSVLRRMKHLLRVIAGHACRHATALQQEHTRTELSPCQAEAIIARINAKVELVPEVCRQAHERIIGGRQVPSHEKILSAHDRDVNVIVRGKAGAQIEFGNTLFLAESVEGLIIDYEIYREAAPAEWIQLCESLERQKELGLEIPELIGADRGFDTKAMERYLRSRNISNAICPRSPSKLKKCKGDPQFEYAQHRRGSTEARVATLKNNILGKVPLAKGFANRACSVGHGVLAHNFLKLAQLVAAHRTMAAAA